MILNLRAFRSYSACCFDVQQKLDVPGPLRNPDKDSGEERRPDRIAKTCLCLSQGCYGLLSRSEIEDQAVHGRTEAMREMQGRELCGSHIAI